MGGTLTARADNTDKAGRKLATYWTIPKEDGKVTLVLAGQPEPATVAIADSSLFAGICQDCSLPFEFKPAEAGKGCNVCGCAVSNASCLVGKPIKGGWQTMLKALPHGTALWITFNDPDKPESGVKKMAVDLKSVLVPVTGLDGQTPDQVLALVKPLGATQAELIDSGKLLSVKLKDNWTADRSSKLEKALAKINAKFTLPEEPKPAQ
jgi:hypothetical protein